MNDVILVYDLYYNTNYKTCSTSIIQLLKSLLTLNNRNTNYQLHVVLYLSPIICQNNFYFTTFQQYVNIFNKKHVNQLFATCSLHTTLSYQLYGILLSNYQYYIYIHYEIPNQLKLLHYLSLFIQILNDTNKKTFCINFQNLFAAQNDNNNNNNTKNKNIQNRK